MPGPDLPEIPAPLKAIQHYLKIASEHDQRDPVVSYWTRLYALQTGLKLSTKTTAENNFLLKLMDWLESTKKLLIDNEAVTNDVAAQAHLENWALKLFLYADKNDRESNFNKSVIQSFYTAGHLYDVLTTFGELTEEAVQNRKYAKWKAAYIHNCLKNGETPVPGPIKEEGEEDDDNSNIDFGPEEDLLADFTLDSEPAEANDGKDEGQADVVTPNEPETAPESAEEAPSEPGKDPAEEAPSEPDIDTADSEPAEVNDGKDEGRDDVVPPNEPDTTAPESDEEAPSEPGVDPAEEAPSEPGVDPAEEAPSEPEVDPAPGIQRPTPPPSTDAFGFPSVPSGWNPAPTPTSSSVSTDSAGSPKPTGGVTLSSEQMNKAQKYIKWAGSAINYDDVPTAIGNLQKALHLLTTGEDS